MAKQMLSLPLKQVLAISALNIYTQCFHPQKYMYPQFYTLTLYILLMHTTFDVFLDVYHNQCLLPTLSPVISRAEFFHLYFWHYRLLPDTVSEFLFTDVSTCVLKKTQLWQRLASFSSNSFPFLPRLIFAPHCPSFLAVRFSHMSDLQPIKCEWK